MSSSLSRIIFFNDLLKKRGKLTIKEFLKEYCDGHPDDIISTRTIQRDIQLLREKFDAPLIYDHKLKVYYYNRDFEPFEDASIRNLNYFALIRSLSRNEDFLPLQTEMFLNQLSGILHKHEKISQKVTYTFRGYEKLDQQLMETAVESLLQEKKVKISYETGNEICREFELDIQRIFNHNGRWYLLAHSLTQNGLRVYLFSRIKRLDLIEIPQEVHYSDIDLDKRINGYFGICLKEPFEAIIRFYHPVGHKLKNRIFHPDQQIEITDNYLQIKLPAGDREELCGLVLSYGQYAEIVSPPEIRDYWLERIRQTFDKFSNNSL